MRQMGNIELVDLARKTGLAVNQEYHLLYLDDPNEVVGHWSSANGWVKQVTLHGKTVDNKTIKEFRALLLINDVHCSVTKRITLTKDFR